MSSPVDQDQNKNDDVAPLDLEAWDAGVAPPADFAERVLARVRREESSDQSSVPVPSVDDRKKSAQRRARRRWLGVATAGVASLAIAAVIMLRVGGPPAQGEAVAKDRTEVALGSRALAVLEPGANVRWDGDDVMQPRGDVFYRVEPGKKFIVHTPAGDVEVKGTCFTVKVRSLPNPAQSLAFVVVHEGKVAVSTAKEHVDLRAGESAQSGPEGVKRASLSSAEAEKNFDERAALATQASQQQGGGDDPATRANQNLVRQVTDYRTRLEAISAQKTELEEKLQESEKRLAASRDGAAFIMPHGFDLSTDDWKDLSKTGTIKFRMPCSSRGEPYTPKPKTLDALGLQPADATVIRDAYAHSNKRFWDIVKPLCAAAIGSADVAEKIGPDTCIHLVLDTEQERDNEAAKRAKIEVGQIRAGLRPMPGPNEKLHPVERIFLAATGESKLVEDELATHYGPEEAHRLIFSSELCFGGSTFGGGSSPD